MSLKIITSGVDCEYVLANLATHLRNKNYEVIELDFGKFKEDTYLYLSQYLNDDIIYITSAHTNLSLRVANTLVPSFVKLYENYLSPLEIISYLKPIVSIYIPHDLLTPYGDVNLNEYRFLDVYDYILAPYDSLQLAKIVSSQRCQIVEAGWIKYEKTSFKEQDSIPTSLFISMVEHLRVRYGIKGFVDYLRPLLQSNTYVKLPVWSSMDTVETALKKIKNIHVIPSTMSSIELICRSKIVICNGASSIHAESSLLGKPTICILDNEGIVVEEQKEKLAHLPNIYFHDYRTKKPIPKNVLFHLQSYSTEPILKPFDYDLFDQIIEKIVNKYCNKGNK